QSRFPRHPDARIGYAPTVPDDYRIVASVGPLRLMPGDAASLTVTVVIAEPEPGTFVSGQTVPPGDPLDPNRQILRVAEGLRQRAIAAEELLDLLPARRWTQDRWDRGGHGILMPAPPPSLSSRGRSHTTGAGHNRPILFFSSRSRASASRSRRSRPMPRNSASAAASPPSPGPRAPRPPA